MKSLQKKQQNNYHIFAGFYDRLMSQKKYLEWGKIIAGIVKKYKIPKGLCLDVACGTGKISEILLSHGFQVIGIDKSKDMLTIAKKRLPQTRFVCEDIRNFDLDCKDSLVFAVSFYDSLNYLLTDEDMIAAFKSIARNIPRGTIFLFDMNTREHVTAVQTSKPIVFEDKDAYIVFRSEGRGRIWILDIDFFVRCLDGNFKLTRERHFERGYNEKDIVPLLKKASFELIETRKEYKEYDGCKNCLSRLYFVVRKI